ncbi:hypothetical protein DP939_15735 [Spongiactinospora rosea]|uniref:D-serine dehydratase-like domain-containing protein n=1 Tax=Spongiactinospora rosea TaxID=2248750 RepID=A0A366M1Q9_9ACTN|nr:alanine racemase [Spongiactinospora rosea]RBQ19372.1 hypothetical protein DP939_15735 [Spongiactinospora rosea]
MTTLIGDPGLRYPLAVLNLDAVRHNLAEMDRHLRDHAALIAPHAKTTMLKEVLTLQTEPASTWGLTVADAVQGRLAEKVGVSRILLANQLVERDDIAWAARAARAGRTVISLVDTEEGVRRLDAALGDIGAASPRHPVLLEVGYAGGRGGTRTREDADAVAAAVAGSRHLVLSGVSGYEGMLGGDATPADIERVDAYLTGVVAVAARLAGRGALAGPILSAGGSAFFDRVIDICREPVAALGATLLLRSGCYAVHDHGLYARTFPGSRSADGPDLRPGATVWARVQSRPEPGRAIVAVGKRHLPYDAGPPVPLGIRYRDGVPGPLPAGAGTARLSDQHLHLDVPPDSDLTVGDVLPFGVSHPCGLFDRWRSVSIVDDEGRLVGTGRPDF